MTQRAVAARADMSESTYSEYELGKRYPRADAFTAIIKALGVSAGDLLAPAPPGQGATAQQELERAHEQDGQPRRNSEEDDDEPGETSRAS